MPVEIRELHIRVTVNAGSDKPGQAGTGAAAKGDGGGEGGTDKDAIVAECVEQVLQIMQSKRER